VRLVEPGQGVGEVGEDSGGCFFGGKRGGDLLCFGEGLDGFFSLSGFLLCLSDGEKGADFGEGIGEAKVASPTGLLRFPNGDIPLENGIAFGGGTVGEGLEIAGLDAVGEFLYLVGGGAGPAEAGEGDYGEEGEAEAVDKQERVQVFAGAGAGAVVAVLEVQVANGGEGLQEEKADPEPYREGRKGCVGEEADE